MDPHPTGLTMVIFVWGAKLYATVMLDPPAGALEVYAVGKQWMWKFQHPDGQREIDELHAPVGHPVQMTMTSQDVIHSFFRAGLSHQNGRRARAVYDIWFEASKLASTTYFCAEYCGTAHSGMRGRGLALPPHSTRSGSAAIAWWSLWPRRSLHLPADGLWVVP